jgi:hypothetical protein
MVGMRTWINPLSEDHATGLELQIQEFVVRRDRARREGWADEVHAAELEIIALRLELAETTAGELQNQHLSIRGADPTDQWGEAPKTA